MLLIILEEFADHVGIVGVILTLIAYAGLSVGKLASDALTYPMLNLIGSCLIIVSLCYHWNLSSFTMEIAWLLISFVGIYHAVWAKKR